MELADDIWASLLPDLLLDIFHRLETAAIIRCATACKPWRRTIISNAASLRRPRAGDSFGPSLLLGFFAGYKIGYGCATLRRTPAPSQPVLPELNARGCCTFVPPPTSGITGGNLLSSRDGFLLVKRRSEVDPISVWNPIARTCKFLPMLSFSCKTYILLTGNDLAASSSSDEPEVRILAVKQERKAAIDDGGGGRRSFRYQLFSAGAWGPVERSQELPEGITVDMKPPGTEVVCRGGTVHWLAWSYDCTVGLDVVTGRTWTTVLPECWRSEESSHRLDLAASRDGRLSVIRLLDQQHIQVWVLTGGDHQWILRRVVDVGELMPDGWHPVADTSYVSVRVFCPRSGCVLVHVDTQQVLVDVDTGSSRRIQGSFTDYGLRYNPYEMDWSYWTMCFSKMKHF